MRLCSGRGHHVQIAWEQTGFNCPLCVAYDEIKRLNKELEIARIKRKIDSLEPKASVFGVRSD